MGAREGRGSKDGMSRVPVVVALAVALLLGGAPAARADGWHATWAAAQQDVYDAKRPGVVAAFPDNTATDTTLRLVVRTTVGGRYARVRLSNRFGSAPMRVGAARVAVRATGDAARAGTTRTLRWSSRTWTDIPAGGEALSDPVALGVPASTDLLVSVWLPYRTPVLTWHGFANTTSYLAAGNRVDDAAGHAYDRTTGSWFWLAGVDVYSGETAGTIAVLGDSITDGNGSGLRLDTGGTWPRALADRLRAAPASFARAVVNHGIGANTVTDTNCGFCGPPATVRITTEVLPTAGLTHVIVLEGTNDIQRNASAAQVIAGLRTIAQRARAAGLRVIGGTITPRADRAYGWDAARMEGIRAQVNHWIRTSGAFHAVLDADVVLRDPARPWALAARYDSGDHLHPNRAGLAAIAAAANLNWFRLR